MVGSRKFVFWNPKAASMYPRMQQWVMDTFLKKTGCGTTAVKLPSNHRSSQPDWASCKAFRTPVSSLSGFWSELMDSPNRNSVAMSAASRWNNVARSKTLPPAGTKETRFGTCGSKRSSRETCARLKQGRRRARDAAQRAPSLWKICRLVEVGKRSSSGIRRRSLRIAWTVQPV